MELFRPSDLTSLLDSEDAWLGTSEGGWGRWGPVDLDGRRWLGQLMGLVALVVGGSRTSFFLFCWGPLAFGVASFGENFSFGRFIWVSWMGGIWTRLDQKRFQRFFLVCVQVLSKGFVLDVLRFFFCVSFVVFHPRFFWLILGVYFELHDDWSVWPRIGSETT